MANEGGYSAGSIFLQVVPSFQGFEAAARRVAKGMEGVIEDGLDKGAEKGATKAEQHVKDALTGPGVTEAAKTGGKKTAEQFSSAFDEIVKKRIDTSLKALGKSAGEQAGEIRRSLEGIRNAKIGVDVDAKAALATLAEAELRARILSNVSPEIDVRTNAGRVAAELNALSREVTKLDGQRAQIKVDADTAKATAQLSAFNKLIGRTGNQAEDTANSFRAFNGVLLTSATIGPALIPILAGIAGGLAALGPAAIAAGAGLGVLGIGFSGLGDAIGALNDVQKNTVKDTQANAKRIRSASDSIADAQKRVNRAQQDAAESASDAARRVRRANEDAAQANEDAARRVVDAQERAARGVEDALERQEDAEKSLADAQRASTQAVQELREARAQAQKDLDDVADKQKRNALDERQAVLDLFDATTEYNAVKDAPGATNYEKEQASINLERARLQLEEIREEEKELAEQRKKGVAGSDVVKNAEDRVKSAVEQQKDAQEALLEAVGDTNQARIDGSKAVAEAIREQNRTEADGAERVADAVLAQRRAAEDSAEAITDAQQALARAQSDYADALFETNEVGSASAQKLKEAMDALGPAGQAFALFIFGLKDEFIAIRDVIQAGLFPGLTEAIQILIDEYLPGFTSFVGEIAKVFGEIAVFTANTLTSDTWKQFFAIFASVSPDLIRNYSIVFLNLATVMAQIMTIAAPFALKFSEALVELTQGAVDFLSSAEGQQYWTDFFQMLQDVGPHVLRFVLALVPAFLALVEALLPFGTLVLDGLTAILNWIAALDPKVLAGIVIGILTLITAFQLAAGAAILFQAATAAFTTPIGLVVAAIVALVGILVYLYTTNETARKIIDAAMRGIAAVATWLFNEILKPAFEYTAWAWTTLAKGFAWAWENILKPVFAAVSAVATWLWEKVLGPVFGFIYDAFKVLGEGLLWIWENISWPVFKVFAQIAWELWEYALKLYFGYISTGFRALADGFVWVYDHILKPLFDIFMDLIGDDLVDTFETAVGWIKKHWDSIREIAKAPVKFVLETVMNNGLIKGFNFLADKLGMTKVDPIPLPKGFKDGGVPYGVRPGYTPGRDTHIIAVGGGEAILRPELTRALGHDWVYEANRRAKRGGVNGAMKFLGGYANGGVVWPVAGAKIGTPFGKRGPMWSSGYHTGTDFPARNGTPIRSVTAGRVDSATWSGWGGNLMKIHVPGLGTLLYAHQSGMIKRQGDQVSAGDTIGYVGSTGNSTGPHLHLELRVGGTPIDPMRLFSGQAIVPGQTDDPEEPSRIDKILGGLKNAASWVKNAVANPLDWLKSKVEGPLEDMKGKFGDTWLTQGLAGIPGKFFGALVDKIKGLVGAGDAAGTGDMSQWTGTTSQLQKMVQGLALSNFGWSGGQWAALNWLVSHESSWNPNAQNPTSSAYGLFQFLDSTWGPYGPKTSDPMKQAQYGLEYIKDRYGSPAQAKAFWEGHHWYADGGIVPGGPEGGGGLPDNGTMMYDNGGYLPPGITQVVNLTGKPEPVFTSDQFDRMRGGAGGGFNYAPTFVGTDLTAEDIASDILFAAKRVGRGGVYAGGKPT